MLKGILFVLILAVPITLIINLIEKVTGKSIINKKIKEENSIEYIKPKEINFDNLKNNDFDKLEIEELRKIYIQLITVETKLDKMNRYLDNINSNLGLITFLIVLPIIIGIILLSQGAEFINNIQ